MIGSELPSPRDIVPQEDISYDPSSKTITIRNINPEIWLTTVQDTNSMDPTVDAGHTCILTKDFKPEDLQVGDIVVYWNGKQDILHRIHEITKDAKGRRFTLKGDNSPYVDPYLVRDEHIRWLLLGIIY